MSTTVESIRNETTVGIPTAVVVALCGTILFALFVFRDALLAMIDQWNSGGTYAHGYLIPVVTGYLLYQQRAELQLTPTKLCWWASILLALCALAWAMSAVVEIELFQQFAALGALLSIVLLFFGTTFFYAALFPLLFLLLAVPVGDGITPHLIDMTADFVVTALRATGIPVYREGTSFVIPSGSWSVVTACSGIRYLMATVTIGTLFAYFNFQAYWRRAVFIGFAVIVAIVGNWLRAYLIVMIGHLSGMRLAVGVDHLIYGWIFFGILIFFLMSVGRMWVEPPTTSIQISHGTSIVPSVMHLTAVCGVVLGILQIAQHWTNKARTASPVEMPALTSAMFPLGPQWTALAQPFTDWRPIFIGGPGVKDFWVKRADEPVGWEVAWYGLQRQGQEVINAENQLAVEFGHTWQARGGFVTVPSQAGIPAHRETVIVNVENQRRLMIWQWYWVDGHYVLSPLIEKFYELRSLLKGRGNPAASLLVYTPLTNDDSDDARARLLETTQALVPRLTLALANRTH